MVQNLNPDIDLTVARKMFVGTAFLQRSVESWKYALWAILGLKVESTIDELCKGDVSGRSRGEFTHKVRMEFYAAKGSSFTLTGSHRQFFHTAKVLGTVLKLYGYAIFFDDKMCWSQLYKLTEDDVRIMHCAEESGHCQTWKDVLPEAGTFCIEGLLR
jgi:hypothetical protein